MALDETENFVSLIVSHIEEDARTFWGQLYSPTLKSELKCLTLSLEKCAKSCKPPLAANNLNKGEVYGCQFQDGFWYRCYVLFSISKEICLVQYIDYGNCEEKNKDCLVSLPSNFQAEKIPAMAHRFRLYDIHIPGANIKCAQTYIEKMCGNSYVKARLMAPLSTSPTEVILYGEDSYDIRDFMVKSGMGTFSADAEEKKSVTMTPPAISMAQKYRNPLLASSDESSDDYNNNLLAQKRPLARRPRTGSQSSGFESMNAGGDHKEDNQAGALKSCQFCDDSRNEMHKMRLVLKKTKHELVEAEMKIEKLVEEGKCWQRQYVMLKTEMEKKNTETVDVAVEESSSPDATASVKASSSPKKTIRIDPGPVTEHPPKDHSIAMKRTVLPAIEFLKKLSATNKCIADCRNCSEKLKLVVKKIKALVDEGKNPNESNFSALLGLRNAALQDMKQLLSTTLPAVSTVDSKAVKTKVDNLETQLKKLTNQDASFIPDEEIEVADILKLIQLWQAKKETSGALTEVVNSLLACLSQQTARYLELEATLSGVKQLQSDIDAFQEQDKSVKALKELNKSIRKKNQKVRTLITMLTNLEEDRKDADEEEGKTMDEEIEKIKTELTVCRSELQDSFEDKWGLMEPVSESAEKLRPELVLEHPDLELQEYSDGGGIFMQGMKLDHFDVSSSFRDEFSQLDCIRTTYMKQAVILLKYPMHSVTSESWKKFLLENADYNHVMCPHAVTPQAVFFDSNIAYVMVNDLCPSGMTLDDKKIADPATVKKLLKEIAAALSALHESGISHGQLCVKAVLLSPDMTAYLKMPKFEVTQRPKKDAQQKNLSYAKDVYHFALLAKHLSTYAVKDQKLLDVIKFCLNSDDSAPADMKSVASLL